jgi:hypothetical protein
MTELRPLLNVLDSIKQAGAGLRSIKDTEAMDRITAGEAVAEVARAFGIDRATVYRLRP